VLQKYNIICLQEMKMEKVEQFNYEMMCG